jgi:hypothetical protein
VTCWGIFLHIGSQWKNSGKNSTDFSGSLARSPGERVPLDKLKKHLNTTAYRPSSSPYRDRISPRVERLPRELYPYPTQSPLKARQRRRRKEQERLQQAQQQVVCFQVYEYKKRLNKCVHMRIPAIAATESSAKPGSWPLYILLANFQNLFVPG